ncbi:hypothetical protein ACSSVY_004120 [Roseovarius sp. MBR-51]
MSSVEKAAHGNFPGKQAASAPNHKAQWLRLIVPLLLISLILPFIINIGSLRLSVYRVILIIAFVPVTFAWLSGRAGRIRVADIAMILLCSWATVSFIAIHGPDGVQAGGIMFIETVGPYLVARVYIRTASDFRAMVKVLFLIVLFLLPFAIIEALTGQNLLLEIMDSIWNSYSRVAKDPRWGLQRVQATFEHPILFGVFCSSVIALTYLVLGYERSSFQRIGTTFLTLLTAGLCLSAGPMTAMTAQLLLIGWNWILKSVAARWKLLAGLIASMWIFLEITATRSPAQIFISYFSFNSFSAYMRLHIWSFGTASILEHPVFGIGFNEWARPSWMSSSIDMYWIVSGVRHGLPATFFSFLGFFSIVVPLMFRKGLDDTQSIYRLGILCCLASFFLAGWTVHYWNATYVLFNFLLGSGVWLLDAIPASEQNTTKEESQPRSNYRRSNTVHVPTTRFRHRRK